DRLLVRLGQKIEFDAEDQVADVIAGPTLSIEWIAWIDAANFGVVVEQRTQVAIDSRVELERTEQLDAAINSVRKSAGDIGDVAEAVHVVHAGAVRARRECPASERFSRRHVPQACV